MRWTRQLLLSLAVVVSATVGLVSGLLSAIWVPFLMDDIEVNAFYSAHPMLRAMRGAPTRITPSGDNPAMTRILLDRVPTGTDRSTAIQILAAENIWCERPVALADRDLLVCGPIKRPCSVSRWYIELHFDELNNVAGGRAFPLKATCEG